MKVSLKKNLSSGSEKYQKNDSPKKLKKIKRKHRKRRKNLKIRFKDKGERVGLG